MRLTTCRIETPIGPLWPIQTPSGLVAMCFNHRKDAQLRAWAEKLSATRVEVRNSGMPEIERALNEYFSENWLAFETIATLETGTPFQKQVWRTLRTIPAGTTWSYKALAEAVGRPTAYRAVANANRQNPLPLLVPCHRVIASDGSLHGFAGGQEVKARLLELEGAAFRR